MKTAGIVIDEWKLPIFKRHLKQAGYAFKNAGAMAGSLVLRVDTKNLVALAEVVKAANEEAALTGEPK
jgi:hypothetical protein